MYKIFIFRNIKGFKKEKLEISELEISYTFLKEYQKIDDI